jgi:hypothetical protein
LEEAAVPLASRVRPVWAVSTVSLMLLRLLPSVQDVEAKKRRGVQSEWRKVALFCHYLPLISMIPEHNCISFLLRCGLPKCDDFAGVSDLAQKLKPFTLPIVLPYCNDTRIPSQTLSMFIRHCAATEAFWLRCIVSNWDNSHGFSVCF